MSPTDSKCRVDFTIGRAQVADEVYKGIPCADAIKFMTKLGQFNHTPKGEYYVQECTGHSLGSTFKCAIYESPNAVAAKIELFMQCPNFLPNK